MGLGVVTRRQSRALKNANAPIHSLAVELLSAIFIQAYREQSTDKRRRLLLENLVSVCSNWRPVTIGTSILWTQVVATTHENRPQRVFDIHIHRLASFLQRSKGAKLNLTIRLHPDKKRTVRLMGHISPCVDRCSLLVIKTTGLTNALPWLSSLKPSQALEELSIRVTKIQEGIGPVHLLSDDCIANPRVICFENISIIPSTNMCTDALKELRVQLTRDQRASMALFLGQCRHLTFF